MADVFGVRARIERDAARRDRARSRARARRPARTGWREPMIALILGGARSGKSRHAQRVATALSPAPVMLATSRGVRRGPRGTHRPAQGRSRPRVDHHRRAEGHREGRARGTRRRGRLRDALAHELLRRSAMEPCGCARGGARRARARLRDRGDVDLRVQRARHGAARGDRGGAKVRRHPWVHQPGDRGARGRRDAHGGGPSSGREGRRHGGSSANEGSGERARRASSSPRPSRASPEDARRAVYDVIALRRDVRHFVPGADVDDATLQRILGAAHLAPSVGFSQPWGFVVVREVATRERIRESFLRLPRRRGGALPARAPRSSTSRTASKGWSTRRSTYASPSICVPGTRPSSGRRCSPRPSVRARAARCRTCGSPREPKASASAG